MKLFRSTHLFRSDLHFRPRRERSPARPPRVSLEPLEARTLLNSDTLVTAPLELQIPLPPALVSTALPAANWSATDQVDLAGIDSTRADRLTAISAPDAGSDVQSLLNFSNQAGQPLALGDQPGGEPHPVADNSAGNGTGDLVAANVRNDAGGLPAGNGDATLQPQVVLAVGDGALNSAVTNLDKGVRPPLVVGSSANDLFVLLGKGGGTSSHPPPLVLGAPDPLVVADSSVRGVTDLAKVNTGGQTSGTAENNGADSSATVHTLPDRQESAHVQDHPGNLPTGNGGDTLHSQAVHAATDATSSPSQLNPHGVDPRALVVGESQARGGSDPAVVNAGGLTSSTESNGVGSVATAQTAPVSQGPDTPIPTDTKGTGQPSLFSSNSGENTGSAFPNSGNGAFLLLPTFGVNGRLDSVGSGDLASEDQLDLAMTSFQDNAITILLGNGEGNFLPDSVAILTPLVNTGTTTLTLLVTLVADFNREQDSGSRKAEAESEEGTTGSAGSGGLASARGKGVSEDTLDEAPVDWSRIPGRNSGVLPEEELRRMTLYRDEERSAPEVPPAREAHHELARVEAFPTGLISEVTSGDSEDIVSSYFSSDRVLAEDLPGENPGPTDSPATSGEHLENTCLLGVAVALLIMDPFRMPEDPERRATGVGPGGRVS